MMNEFEEWYKEGRTDWHSPKEIARMAWNEGVRQSAKVPIKMDTEEELNSTKLYQRIKQLESNGN